MPHDIAEKPRNKQKPPTAMHSLVRVWGTGSVSSFWSQQNLEDSFWKAAVRLVGEGFHFQECVFRKYFRTSKITGVHCSLVYRNLERHDRAQQRGKQLNVTEQAP